MDWATWLQLPFKNNCPGLDDCTLIENTRTHFSIIRNTWFHIFLLNSLPFFLLSLSLSLMFLLFHIFQMVSQCITSPPACCYQSFYLSISLLKLNQRKKTLGNPANRKPQNPLYPSIPTQKRRFVKAVSRVAPLSEAAQKRQEYDVRHSILVPGSDALRPKLATKAALKCLQRAEGGGGWREKSCGQRPVGFFDDIVYIIDIQNPSDIENHRLFLFLVKP